LGRKKDFSTTIKAFLQPGLQLTLFQSFPTISSFLQRRDRNRTEYNHKIKPEAGPAPARRNPEEYKGLNNKKQEPNKIQKLNSKLHAVSRLK
jgi:hypothetical protein